MKLYSLALLALFVVPLSQMHGPTGPLGQPVSQDDRQGTDRSHGPMPRQRVEPTQAIPEIDPASAGSALAFLVGALCVLRGRRSVPPVRPL